MKMRDNHALNISRLETPARQLCSDAESGIKIKRSSTPVQRERKVASGIKQTWSVTAIPQKPAMIRMTQQGHQRMTGNPTVLPSSDEMVFPGQTIASVKDITL